jgi:TRAP-type C4-dicarboxylate transport system substrate-binding protein
VRENVPGVVGVVAALSVAIGAAGCGGAGDDRAGGKASPKPVTLTLASPLPDPAEIRPFADEVERLSHGRVKIRFRNGWLGSPWRAFEAALIRDVIAGKADLGWIGIRSWHDVGVTSFDALQAPLVVDSYALQGAVLESGVADPMLEDTEPLGLVGLGVVPGPLRKLLGVDRPLTRVADFAGLRIGLNRSPLGNETLRALGAFPVTVRGGANFDTRLDGLEQHVASIEGNAYDDAAKYLTANVNLWPRLGVVFMNAKSYEKLDDSQRDALHEAIETATPIMLAAAEADQEASTATVCGRGLKLAVASAAVLAQLRAAVAPVVERLRRDPATADALEQIERLRESEATPPDSNAPCPAASTPKQSAVLDGTYVHTTTAADARRARIPVGDPIYKDLPMHYRLVLKQGVFKVYDTNRHGERDVHAGTYTLYRDRILFVDPPDRLPFAWSFDGKTLRFDDEGKGGYFGAQWTPPWRKVE